MCYASADLTKYVETLHHRMLFVEYNIKNLQHRKQSQIFHSIKNLSNITEYKTKLPQIIRHPLDFF